MIKRKSQNKNDSSQEKFSIIFESSPVAMSLATIPDGKLVDVNQAWLELVGITNKKEVHGKTSSELGLVVEGGSRDIILNEYKRIGAVKNAEITARTKDGSTINLLVNVKEVTIAGENYLLSINENITHRKLAEEAIINNQKTLSELVDRAPFGIYIIDSDFRILLMNYDAQNTAFRNVRPALGRNFSEAMHILWPDDVAEGIISEFRHTLDTGEPYYSPRFVSQRNDITITESYEWELHRMTLPDGRYGVICYYFDSTKLREAEKAREESEAKYRDIVETAGEGIIIVSTEGHFRFVNRKFAEMLGYAPEEIIGHKSNEFLYDKQEAVKLPGLRDHLKRGSSLQTEMKFRRKDGTLLWTLYNATPVFDSEGKHTGNLAMHTNITERKLAEEKLMESEERFRSVLENSLDCIYRFNIQEKRYEYISPSAKNLIGYSAEELMALEYNEALKMVDPDFISVLREAQELSEITGKAETEYRQRTKSGEYRWISNHMTVVRDDTGKPLYRDGNLRDITRRKQAETALKEARNKLNMALDKANIGIWEWNLKTDEVILDERLEMMLGLEPGTFCKTYSAFVNLVNEEDLSHVQTAIKNSLENDLPYETVFRVRSGDKTRYISSKANRE